MKIERFLVGSIACFVAAALTLMFLLAAGAFGISNNGAASGEQLAQPKGVSELAILKAEQLSFRAEESAVPAPPVIENTGIFELPIEGSHGIALVNLKVYKEDGPGKTYSHVVTAATPFTILKDGETRVLGHFKDGGSGWLKKNYIMVNLPDIIPSIIYKNSNAEASLMKNLGGNIDGVTGEALYKYKTYNEKLGKEEYIMPVQYRMAEKLMAAQNLARERGLSIVLYEGFRPAAAQTKVANSLKTLAANSADTRASIRYGKFSMDFYISVGVSSHQMGSAVDASLAQVFEWENVSINGNIVSMPKAFEEFQYGAIQSGNGVLLGNNRYQAVLPEDTSFWMPTPMHELSYLAGTFTAPTKTYSHGAWKTALNSGAVKRALYWTGGAQTMQDIFTAAGMDPLASEWWHFNDVESRNRAKAAGATGKFEVGAESFSMPPAAAVELREGIL